jgi:hypothetical protein
MCTKSLQRVTNTCARAHASAWAATSPLTSPSSCRSCKQQQQQEKKKKRKQRKNQSHPHSAPFVLSFNISKPCLFSFPLSFPFPSIFHFPFSFFFFPLCDRYDRFALQNLADQGEELVQQSQFRRLSSVAQSLKATAATAKAKKGRKSPGGVRERSKGNEQRGRTPVIMPPPTPFF